MRKRYFFKQILLEQLDMFMQKKKKNLDTDILPVKRLSQIESQT